MEKVTSTGIPSDDVRARITEPWELVAFNKGRNSALKHFASSSLTGLIGICAALGACYVGIGEDMKLLPLLIASVLWASVLFGRWNLSPSPKLVIGYDEFVVQKAWERNSQARLAFLYERGVKLVIRWVNILVWGGLVALAIYGIHLKSA